MHLHINEMLNVSKKIATILKQIRRTMNIDKINES